MSAYKDSQGCAATDAVHSKIYLFGGIAHDAAPWNLNMYVYSQASNAWSLIPAVSGTIPVCVSTTATIWKEQIAYADNEGVYLFDIASSTWKRPMPLPPGTWDSVWVTSPADGNLYLVAAQGSTDAIFKYNH
jgi:hypothetical protein